MMIFRPRPILALCGAACLIAFTPYARRPPAELGALVRTGLPPNASDAGDDRRVDKLAPFASADPNVRYAPPLDAASSDANLAAQFAYADIPDAAPPPADSVGSADVPSAPTPAPATGALGATASDANLAAQFAYADIPDAAAPPAASAGAAPVRARARPCNGDAAPDASAQLGGRGVVQ